MVQNHDGGVLKECSGIVVNIYQYLWSKNRQGESCAINLPHTVVYKDSRPQSWYFSSLKTKKVLRKHNSKLLGPTLIEAFTSSKERKADLCAWCSGSKAVLDNNSKKKAVRRVPISIYEEYDSDDDLEEVQMEPLSHRHASMLLDPGPYRRTREELREGVVQQFVTPRDPRDFILRAIWSPAAVIYEKLTNKHRLVDLEYMASTTPVPERMASTTPVPERMASFSASMLHHDHMLIPHGALRSRLEEQCEAVISHLRDMPDESIQVARMDLFFKIDVENRIWFLYCDSLQLQKLPSLKPPHRLDQQTVSRDLRGQIEPDDFDFLCVASGKLCHHSLKVEVSYKRLIEHWIAKSSDLILEDDRLQALDAVPPALRRANPNMTREFYVRHRSQPFFLYSTASVCQEAVKNMDKYPPVNLTNILGLDWEVEHKTSIPSSPEGATRSYRAVLVLHHRKPAPLNPRRLSMPMSSSNWGSADFAERRGSLSMSEMFLSVGPSSWKAGVLIASTITEEGPTTVNRTSLSSGGGSVPGSIQISGKRSCGSMLSSQSVGMYQRDSYVSSAAFSELRKHSGTLVVKESKAHKRLLDAQMHARLLPQEQFFVHKSYDPSVTPCAPMSTLMHAADMGMLRRPFTRA
ncbi:hypothetical protein CEUSTIGMA_g178.t1 [Chlamydomonas eustigma]|uniref:Uncharacterized protein n=1 Tax=Chlamydomonas eustigma TaxID=1157962 RepID=A0A250WPY7_9CHLO|nr:hypothetical protein CEUSTIGMA_g178.t1 [Chlamydomonas eustigma]|eukprot:GAX72722.1 hypothetical protein CEUSTIGMA_g178.t1 [Chlamydomonas eustigma]